jgi:TonB family protein
MAGISPAEEDEMTRSRRAFFLSLALALWAVRPGAAAAVPWGRIDAGLAQLADGDGEAAAATFQSARSTDDSGVAKLLVELTRAYVAYNSKGEPDDRARSMEANARLDIANRHFYELHIPSAVLDDTLALVRERLDPRHAKGSSPTLLRPLLCNLRLLVRDRAMDQEPIDLRGPDDGGSLTCLQPVFAPSPPFTAAAKEARTQGRVVVELVVDSEGCPGSETLVESLPNGLGEQTMATLRWWAFEPARYDGTAVKRKVVHTTKFVVL